MMEGSRWRLQWRAQGPRNPARKPFRRWQNLSVSPAPWRGRN